MIPFFTEKIDSLVVIENAKTRGTFILKRDFLLDVRILEVFDIDKRKLSFLYFRNNQVFFIVDCLQSLCLSC